MELAYGIFLPWLRINIQCLSSNKQYDIAYPYPQVQPPNTKVSSIYYHVYSQLSLSSSSADIFKKSGSKVFKIERLKKDGKSQARTSCVEGLNARQKLQETPLVKSMNKGITSTIWNANSQIDSLTTGTTTVSTDYIAGMVLGLSLLSCLGITILIFQSRRNGLSNRVNRRCTNCRQCTPPGGTAPDTDSPR